MEAGERVVGVNGSADERQHAGELLQVRGVFKSFGGTEALADVGMTLKAGEILALLGRERRRQVDADQDFGRRLHARRRQRQLSRRRRHSRACAACRSPSSIRTSA